MEGRIIERVPPEWKAQPCGMGAYLMPRAALDAAAGQGQVRYGSGQCHAGIQGLQQGSGLRAAQQQQGDEAGLAQAWGWLVQHAALAMVAGIQQAVCRSLAGHGTVQQGHIALLTQPPGLGLAKGCGCAFVQGSADQARRVPVQTLEQHGLCGRSRQGRQQGPAAVVQAGGGIAGQGNAVQAGGFAEADVIALPRQQAYLAAGRRVRIRLPGRLRVADDLPLAQARGGRGRSVVQQDASALDGAAGGAQAQSGAEAAQGRVQPFPCQCVIHGVEGSFRRKERGVHQRSPLQMRMRARATLSGSWRSGQSARTISTSMTRRPMSASSVELQPPS